MPSNDRRLVRRWIVGGGLVFPGVVLAALLAHTAARTVALDDALPGAEPVISVTAHSWWWQVRYRTPAGSDVVLANEVHVPAGRPVTLGLASADVIHSFWVPQLAGKIDMVPGRVHRLRLQADRPGVYRGQCAEFCGAQHARMALLVVAHEPADYERWLAAQARPAAVPADAQAERGRAVFEAQRCSACHTVRGVATGLALAPTSPTSAAAANWPPARGRWTATPWPPGSPIRSSGSRGRACRRLAIAWTTSRCGRWRRTWCSWSTAAHSGCSALRCLSSLLTIQRIHEDTQDHLRDSWPQPASWAPARHSANHLGRRVHGSTT